MFSLSIASSLFQRSTQTTWSCVLNFAKYFWRNQKTNTLTMHEARKRYHSHSRSNSRTYSRDRSFDRKKIKTYPNGRDRDGKRRKLDSYDSPSYKKSVSSQRAHRSRQYERGSSAERRYKRSRRRSRTSKKHRHYHDKKRHRRSDSAEHQTAKVASVEDDDEGHLIYETGDIIKGVTIEGIYCAVYSGRQMLLE